MTFVWNINCHKWRNVALGSLWILTTIGLGLGMNVIIQDVVHNGYQECISENVGWTYDSTHTITQCFMRTPQIIGWVFGTIANIVNTLFIWLVINTRYELIKVNCVSNDKITGTLTEKEE